MPVGSGGHLLLSWQIVAVQVLLQSCFETVIYFRLQAIVVYMHDS